MIKERLFGNYQSAMRERSSGAEILSNFSSKKFGNGEEELVPLRPAFEGLLWEWELVE